MTAKPPPAPSPAKRLSPAPVVVPSPVLAKKKAPPKIDLTSWEHETVGFVFNVTFEVRLMHCCEEYVNMLHHI